MIMAVTVKTMISYSS